MPKGRKSAFQTITEKLGKSPFDLFISKEFNGVSSLEQALAKLGELGVSFSATITIENMIRKGLEEKNIKKDHPCVAWLDAKPEGQKGQRGKKSIQTLVFEKTGEKNLFKFLNSDKFAGKNAEEATQILNKMGVKVALLTLKALIVKAIKNNEVLKEDQCATWVASQGGGRGQHLRGKTPMRTLLENHFGGKSIWDIFRENFSDINNLGSAAEKIQEITKGKVKTSAITVQNAIEKGLENGEIKHDESFLSWYSSPKKRGQKEHSEEPTGPQKNSVAVTVECSHCGVTIKEAMYVSDDMDFGVQARRCRSCDKWKTFIVRGKLNGVSFTKAIAQDEDGFMIEQFVNEKLKPIQNPFAGGIKL